MRHGKGECRAEVGHARQRRPPDGKVGKAGRKGHMGVRQQDARHGAMNPVDHPNCGRGLDDGRRHPSRHGRAQDRLPHAQEDKSSEPTSGAARRRGKGQEEMSRSSKKGPWVRRAADEPHRMPINAATTRKKMGALVACIDDLPGAWSATRCRARAKKNVPVLIKRVDGRPKARRSSSHAAC